MENAAKALIMAGSMLIAMLIIGVLVYMWASSSELFNQNEKTELAEQIVAFNNEYEGYNRKLLRGTDVISAMNKAESNNRKYKKAGMTIRGNTITPDEMEEPNYYVNVNFIMVEKTVYTEKEEEKISKTVTFKAGEEYQMEEYFSNISQNEEAFTDFKRRIFDCQKVGYNQRTGRVNYLLFKERKMTEDEYKFGF